MTGKLPPAPRDAKAPGCALWTAVLTDYELEEHEMALLVELVRTVDALDELDQLVRAEGVVHESPQGSRAHPALVEARQQRIALARLQAALRLPAGDEDDPAAGRRPQRRVGVRGTYGFGVA